MAALVLSSAQSSPEAVVAQSDNNKARPRLRLRSFKEWWLTKNCASAVLGRICLRIASVQRV